MDTAPLKSPTIESLNQEDARLIEEQIKFFLTKSESRWVAIADKGGNLFAQVGDTTNLDLGILSALGAGSFAATHELAKRLGEKDFSCLYHEGQELSVLMTALEFECLLITSFDKQTNVGLVRLCAQEIAPVLNDLLKTISSKNT